MGTQPENANSLGKGKLFMKLKGSITISRCSNSHGPDTVRVRLVDEIARIAFAEAEVSLENWGLAVTGRGYVDCLIEVKGIENIGTVSEHKIVLVPYKGSTWTEAGKAAARRALAKFEIDGWKGREDDLYNHHHHSSEGIHVNMFRHVPKR
jgi:hypothetical protein